jgi:tetratricopeptide (TPR) repeat protein
MKKYYYLDGVSSGSHLTLSELESELSDFRPVRLVRESEDDDWSSRSYNDMWESCDGQDTDCYDAKTADAYYDKGETHFKSKRYAKAIDCYEGCIAINPNHADA